MFDLSMHESSPPSNTSPKDESPKGRILGLDIGDRRIGAAISDPLYITAQGLPTITRKGIKQDIRLVLDLIINYKITKIVYGLPKNMNGSLGHQAEKTQRFIERLKPYTDCPCIPWDERLTSVQAKQIMHQMDKKPSRHKTKVDAIASILLLQNYLDFQKGMSVNRGGTI